MTFPRRFAAVTTLSVALTLSLFRLSISNSLSQTPLIPDQTHSGPIASLHQNQTTDNNDLTQSVDGGEMRGMWVVRESLATPASVHRVVETAVKHHLNTIFVQVRGRGEAWYDSPYEPRADALASQSADFDPLMQVVEEGHARGLMVHAWINTFLTWSGSRTPSSPNHLWNAHKDWFACDRNGHCTASVTQDREGAFLQPSNPAVQEHLFNIFTYVAKNYDVDGIHFDYCRYSGSDSDFSRSTLERFRAYMKESLLPDQITLFDGRLKTDRLAYVHAWGNQWSEWRRSQITGLVGRISKSVKANKPWLQVSAAVFADAEDARNLRGQDWGKWLKEDYLDAVALMSYDRNTDRILRQTRAAVAIAGDKQVYTGIGAWRLPASDVARKITEVRKTGASGVNLFSYDDVHTKPEYLGTLSRGVFASRSAPRRMRWLPDRDASPTRGGTVDRGGSTTDRSGKVTR